MDYILKLCSEYGVIIIFLVLFLEHMNVPGLAAGAILSSIGFLVYRGQFSFLIVLIICVVAGVLASIILYFLGYFIGARILDFFVKKIPKSQKAVNKSKKLAENNVGRITCRFLPVVRTIIPVVEGCMRIDFYKSLFASVTGVLVYNTAFLAGGYIVALVTLR